MTSRDDHDGPPTGPAPAAADDEFAPEELALLRSFFRDEAQEALDRMTSRLLGAGSTPLGHEVITELMRTTHTLKGSAGTVGLDDVVGFAHELEDELARLRDGGLAWSAIVHDQLVAVVDAMRAYVDAIGTPSGMTLLHERVVQHLAALRTMGALPAEPALPGGLAKTPEALDPDQTLSLWPDAWNKALALDPEETHSLWPDTWVKPRPRIRVATHEPPGEETLAHDISDGIVARHQHPDETTRSIVANTYPVDLRRDSRGVLRIDASRIDVLMDSVGELVFDRTRIERRVQSLRTMLHDLARMSDDLRASWRASGETSEPFLAAAMDTASQDLAERIAQMQKTTAELLDDAQALRRTSMSLQTGLTRVRMSTARVLFQTLARQLRIIARSAGKKVRLITSGDDTEFDKTVAERITDPLIQLLRNAVAHGIEPEPVRLAAGKSAVGEVRIHARQEGSSVVIEVLDDGAGIDPDALRERFVAAGRWSRAKADLASDEDVLRAIFDPGVSTRDEVDFLAGRGIGLDAVREIIAQLGGEIRMTSTPGRGTCFTMHLPVSTAVSQAMLFTIYRDVYAVPLVHVVETTEIELLNDDRPSRLEVLGSHIPLVWLQSVLESESPVEMPVLPVIVLAYAGRRVAITCDGLVGPHEIVVKELGPLLSPLSLYAGATISSSGKVQLILDPAALMRLAYPGSLPVPVAHVDSSPGTASRHALIVDDSPAIRHALTRILADSGYVVDTAEDGARAWAMISEADYDLVITDIEMPFLDGFALIERLRQDTRHARVNVIVVTSSDTPEHRERARKLAVTSFVVKPVTPRKMHDALAAREHEPGDTRQGHE